MTELWTGYAIVLLIMFIGVMGNLIPGIPGTPLILAGALGHQLYFGYVSWWWVAELAALGLVALGLDYLATLIGAKKLGATWKGMVGAVLGLALGVLGKLICSVVMFALFAFAAWPNADTLLVAPEPETPAVVEAPAGGEPEAARD